MTNTWRFLVIFLVLSVPAYADKIILKDGNMIDGTIVERQKDRVIVDVGGNQVTYYFKDVAEVSDSGNISPIQGEVANKEVLSNETIAKMGLTTVSKVPEQGVAKTTGTYSKPTAAGPTKADLNTFFQEGRDMMNNIEFKDEK